MASDEENDLPQTQSQTHDDNYFTQPTQTDERDVWGRLLSKHESFHSVELLNELFTVGRSSACDYVLKEPEIKQKFLPQMSKQHFQIRRNLNDVTTPTYIEDCSRNGTFINEERIGYQKKRILAHGDIISITLPKYQSFVFKDHRRNPTEIPDKLAKKYHVGKKLGSGACGTVYLVHDYRTCQPYALKHIKKNILMNYRSDKALNEANIMKKLTHPCIIKMHDIFDSSDSVYITLELMKGGELLTRIQKKKFLPELNSKLYFYQMCHAIKYLHDKKITHRDLKPDNILLASTEENTLLKISDFGLSKIVKNNSVLRTLCGTPLYVAPEILLTNGKGEYTEKVDVWSLGVVLFTMLSGTLPFADDYGSPATEQIKMGHFQFRSSRWKCVTSTAKTLIRELLTTDVKQRPSINELLRHKWLKDPDVIELAHTIMNIPMPEQSIVSSTVSSDDKPSVFLRPYKVDIDSENFQARKRQRLC